MSNFCVNSIKELIDKEHNSVSSTNQSSQTSKIHNIILKIEKYINKAKILKEPNQLLRDLEELQKLTETLQSQPLQWITK